MRSPKPRLRAAARFLPTGAPVLDGDEKKYLLDCLRRNWISSGGYYTRKLEEAFAGWVGTQHAVTASSGTAALHLALAALGIGPGDEVIIPDFTIICSASMPILVGAKPVLVDVDEYWCIDPEKIEAAITRRTKAIMVVHVYGNPANMKAIHRIARAHHLRVIEDACAAHGAVSDGKKVGSIGDVGIFSFYATKTITSGEGGMVVTNNKALASRVRILKNQAFESPRFVHRFLGFNYRLTDLQCAVAYAQMAHADGNVARRREIANTYTRLIGECEDISTHRDPPWGKSSYWMFGVVIKKSFGRTRDEVMALLAKKGIGTERFFCPMSQQPVFRAGRDARYPDTSGSYPVSRELGQWGLYLPSGLGITLGEQRRVVRTLLSLRKHIL